MGKRTEADETFIKLFSKELKRKYATAKRLGETDERFAASIGVERVSLRRYLEGETMPEHRTIVLAFRNHQIAVPYDQTDATQLLRPSKKTPTPKVGVKKNAGGPIQGLELPFSIRAQAVDLKIRPVSSTEIDLGVTLRKA